LVAALKAAMGATNRRSEISRQMVRHWPTLVVGIVRVFMSRGRLAHVNPAGDGGGDEGGAAFLQQVDGALGFGGESVELYGFRVQIPGYLNLFFSRGNRDDNSIK
jgi:hypothetical protein